jgi:hypothetical protein
MISQQIGFSILTAPLAAIDRRSLSQAWYSALHLARPNPRSSRGQPSSNQVVCKREHRPNGETPHIVRPVQRPAGAVPKEHALRRGAPSPERRAERSPLARRIERAFLDPVRRTDRATFTLDGSSARVHIALQTTTSGIRLIAVCSAAIRAGVARALDEARYALAVRGIALHVDVNEA